ncbi:MAG: M20/M25/M40 family metallo-hydrolase [Fimbriimonadaceae bacterium]
MHLRHVALVSLFASAVSAAIAQYAGVLPPPANYKQGFDTISPELCKQWLTYLAGPETAGRGTGQPGYQKAAEFMAARFKEFGLKPGGDAGTYFQNVPFWRQMVIPEQSSIEVNGSKIGMKGNFSAAAGKDAVIEGDVLAIVGAGVARLEDPAIVKDKIVFITGDGSRGLRRQVSVNGALAVFSVVEGAPLNAPRVSRNAPPEESIVALSGSISESAYKRLATMLDLNGGTVALAVSKGSTKAKITLRAVTEQVMAPNVIAVLPGTDPVLKSEAVGLGSHLDHDGIRDGVINPGADDDGSGSTALLAVAKAFSKNKVKPKRSIIFMAFSGEEMGLIGSKFQADNLFFPADKMTAELQMDMVGRNEESQGEKPEDNLDTIHLIGSKRISTELHELVLRMNGYVGFKFEYDEESVYTRSDHYNFAAKGIPIAFLFTGFHPDYHQPTDTVDKINFDKIANTARLFYLVAQEAANMPAMLKREVVK